MKIDDSWHSWFSGFVDGEGCFTVSNYGSWDQGQTVLPLFIIVCRADDVDVLTAMKKVFGGRIYYRKVGKNQLKRAPGTKPSCSWTVNTKKGLRLLVKQFDKYPLRSKKKRDYKLWREAVIEYLKPPKIRNKAKIYMLADQIKEIKGYNAEFSEPIEEFDEQLVFELCFQKNIIRN